MKAPQAAKRERTDGRTGEGAGGRLGGKQGKKGERRAQDGGEVKATAGGGLSFVRRDSRPRTLTQASKN